MPCIDVLWYSIRPCTWVTLFSVDILKKIESKIKQDIPGMDRIDNLLENDPVLYSPPPFLLDSDRTARSPSESQWSPSGVLAVQVESQ